ncbi:hypothetical protein ACDX77_19220 [Bacillus velezensis]|uniref:hypothetical protein n=1 Tax=Bacillus velezensis TaxID=492670 RepID=UPI003556E1C4
MDKEAVRDALAELIGESYKGRKWFFPRNVDNRYKVFGNVTVKEMFTILAPFFLLAAGLAWLPPYSSVLFWIIKFFLIVLLISAPVVYISYRPIKHRENIRTKDWIKEVIVYRKKQKMFFIKPKNKELI